MYCGAKLFDAKIVPFADQLLAGKTNPLSASVAQGCQMACFQAKNTDLGKFWRASEWKM
jgi:hypothetical protein